MSSDLISPAIVKGWGCIDTFIYLHRLSDHQELIRDTRPPILGE
jgi:hypothetical protein